MPERKKKIAAWIGMAVLLLWYVAGALTNFAGSGNLSFHPAVCLAAGMSRAGIRCMVLLALILSALAMGISLKGRGWKWQEGRGGQGRKRE